MAEPEMVKLLAITKENIGDGWSPGYAVSEFEIPKNQFLKHCKRVSMSEPDQFSIMLTNLTKKARELLGI